jgi:hypothetical protein
MCTDLATDAKLAGGWGDAWNYLNNALMLYGEVWHGYGLQCSDYGWQDQAISAEGYTAAISGESAFDYCYLAITNRQVTSEDEAGYDVPLRIMSYWNSTCNEEAYILAYKNNLKGITVYRNNSRQFQPMNLDDKKKEKTVEMKAVESEPIVKEEEIVEEYNPTGELKTVKCPECGTEIQMAEGCFICLNCGYSGCS